MLSTVLRLMVVVTYVTPKRSNIASYILTIYIVAIAFLDEIYISLHFSGHFYSFKTYFQDSSRVNCSTSFQ